MILYDESKNKYAIDDRNEIQRGGEGRIVLIPSEPDLVAKIYLPGIRPIQEAQFRALQQLDSGMFVRPLHLLSDAAGKVHGFLMHYLDKEFFALSRLFNRAFLSSLSDSDSLINKVINRIVSAVEYAHTRQVIIGDLNPFNVMVNQQGEVRFIDTDSYGTPAHPHSGVLLDDIRDFYYQGQVSQQSDFFALAVLVYQLLTGCHPFKGIHPVYKTLADREINRLPVFAQASGIVIPKCHTPLADKALQAQFEMFFLQGKRFMLQLRPHTRPVVMKAVQQVSYADDALISKELLEKQPVIGAFFDAEGGWLETREGWVLFRAKAKGELVLTAHIFRHDFSRLFFIAGQFYALKNNTLGILEEGQFFRPFKNLSLNNAAMFWHTGSILLCIGSGFMTQIFLSQVVNGHVRTRRVEVNEHSFYSNTALYQFVGGMYHFFCEADGGELATLTFRQPLVQAELCGNIGMIAIRSQTAVEQALMRVEGLGIVLHPLDRDSLTLPGIQPLADRYACLYLPDDDRIEVLHSGTFETLAVIPCSLVSRQSRLWWTKAGLIVLDDGRVWLVNKR